MSDSSETNVIYKDKNGSNLHIMNKEESTSTTMHFNMIANPDKSKNIVHEKPEEDSESIDSDMYGNKDEKSSESSKSSETSSSSKSKSSSSTKSKTQSVITKIEFNKPNVMPTINQPNFSGFTQPQHPPVSEINPTIKQLSPLEMKKRKIELLRSLAEIKEKGYELSKEYNINSSLEEMETEVELLRSFANKSQAINLGKGFLINTVGFFEFMNEKYDPFSFELKDWSKQVAYDCSEHEYDEVLGEIYEKYKGSGKGIEPEFRLALLLGMSAASYHVTRSKLKPKNNDENNHLTSMVTKMGNKVLNSSSGSRFKTPDEIKIEQLKLQQKEKERQLKLQQQELMMKQQQISQTFNKPNIEIKGPKNVNEILKKLNDTYKPVQNDTDSERKISENLTDSSKSSKKGRPKKKNSTLNLNL